MIKAERPPKKEKTTKKEIIKKEAPPKAESVKKPPLKKRPGAIYKVFKEPHISEKATQFFDEGKYTFRVFPWANKIEIKKAIKNIYGVDVLKVMIIGVPKKPRRMGKQKGWRQGYKKAIVRIKEGQNIEVLPR